MKRGLFHIFAKGLTDLISLRAYWCVSIGACFMQRRQCGRHCGIHCSRNRTRKAFPVHVIVHQMVYLYTKLLDLAHKL